MGENVFNMCSAPRARMAETMVLSHTPVKAEPAPDRKRNPILKRVLKKPLRHMFHKPSPKIPSASGPRGAEKD